MFKKRERAMSGMIKVFLKRFVIATMAPSMRSPSGLTGWFARKMMQSANPESTRFAIQHRLHLKDTDVFVELGAGEGSGLLAATTPLADATCTATIPSIIHLVEISDAMRVELERVVAEDLPEAVRASTTIHVHGDDCIRMSYLDDDSVDKIFAMNVVYFLDPLPDYLSEIHRVLKPGTGEIVWGCKFDKVPQDNNVFVNVKEDDVVMMMKEAGFDVTATPIDVVAGSAVAASADAAAAENTLSKDMRNYIEIRGRKIQ